MVEKLNLDELAKQKELTEEQQKQIHDEAYEEEESGSEEDSESKEESGESKEGEEKEPEGKEGEEEPNSEEDEGEESGEEEEEKSEEDLLNADEKDLTDDEKAKRQEILDTKAKELLDTPDEELDEEQLEEKKELLKSKKESEEDKQKEFDERVTEYSKSNELSEEDARKELKQIDEIKDRYEGDVDKVAKSNLYLQRMASKTKNELKKAQEASQIKEVTPEHLDKMVKNGQFIVKGRAFNEEALVQIGRTNPEWADIQETLDDDQLYRLVINDLAKKQNQSIEKQQGQFKQKAATKRIESIKDLSNYDNRFYEEAKGIIENLDDRYIASDSFNVKHVLTQVKGGRYDADIKKAKDEAYKRGIEKAKIMDKKTPVGEGRNKKSKSGSKAGSRLNDAQKKEALDMFESAEVADEKKFQMYLNVNPDLKKKK